MSLQTSPRLRHCPTCRATTHERHCPADGTATFILEGIDVMAVASLHAGALFADRYRVVRRVGKGGFGAVYEAEHTGSGQRVALKVLAIDPDDAGQDVFFRFFREARVTAGLKHPNTVRLFDFGQADTGALYMAMELLSGPTLEKHLQDRLRAGAVMTMRETAEMALPILRSLAEAHGVNLVHRDLKPDNIILADLGEDQPVVKVLDFGIARSEDSKMTAANKVLGTPQYMSPEQCRGARTLDGRSDLYSLGIIMYRCVAGKSPFSGDMFALLHAHVQEPPPSLRQAAKTELSDGFVSVVMQALAKNPDDRFADAKTMRQALESVLGGTWAGTPAFVPAGAHEQISLNSLTTAMDSQEETRVVDVDEEDAATRMVATLASGGVAAASSPGPRGVAAAPNRPADRAASQPLRAVDESAVAAPARRASASSGTLIADIDSGPLPTTPDWAQNAKPGSVVAQGAAQPDGAKRGMSTGTIAAGAAVVVVVVAVATWLAMTSGNTPAPTTAQPAASTVGTESAAMPEPKPNDPPALGVVPVPAVSPPLALVAPAPVVQAAVPVAPAPAAQPPAATQDEPNAAVAVPAKPAAGSARSRKGSAESTKTNKKIQALDL